MEALQRLHNRGSISTGYTIDNSLKLEADNTEYLSRTPSSNTNRQTWTFSTWVKRAELGQNARLIDVYVDGQNFTTFGFDTSDRLVAYAIDGGVDYGGHYSPRFRDTSAWYHIIWKSDITNATAANRWQIYVNGVEVTDKDIDYGTPPTNFFPLINITYSTKIGYNTDGSNPSSQYMAETHLIDGTALAPTDFGEFDEDSGIWKPKAYEGTYGTNGFYLDFESSGSLGADSSGNGNNFTLNNITSADQATDTPTNNFCTLNFNTGYIQGSDATTFTQGATTRQGGSGSYNGALGTMGINPFVGSAKWYWEVELSANNNGTGIELAAGWLATSIAQSNTSNKATAGNGAGFQIWTSFDWSPPTEGTGADGDIFGFLLQCDSSSPSLKIYKNDTLFTTRLHSLPYDFENDFYFPVVFIFNTGLKAFCNFGNPFDATISSGNTDPNSYGNFEFDTKGGYALCTKNLEEFG